MAGVEQEAVKRLRTHVETLAVAPRHRSANASALEAARQYVADRLETAGWIVRRQDIQRRFVLGVSETGEPRIPRVRLHHNIHGTNLIAVRPGSRGPYLIVGAHLDTVMHSPGADDNGSGVAIAIELAQRLSVPDSEHVMIAVFDCEETGLIGSRYLAREMAKDRNASSMICLESVGFYNHEPDSQRVPWGLRNLLRADYATIEAGRRRGDFVAVVHRRSSSDLAKNICSAAKRHSVTTIRVRDPRPDGLAGVALTALVPPLATLDRSDHSPFWRRRIPSVMLTDTANLRNPHYHRPEDVASTLDYSMVSLLCETLCEAVRGAR